MTRRVVLDTNVILSAILCGGNPAEYFALAIMGKITLCLSPFILDETLAVLQRKFKWSKSRREQLSRWLKSISEIVPTEPSIKLIRRKDSDNRILECALAARADLLVTGDQRDILPLGRIGATKIVSPIAGLKLLEG